MIEIQINISCASILKISFNKCLHAIREEWLVFHHIDHIDHKNFIQTLMIVSHVSESAWFLKGLVFDSNALTVDRYHSSFKKYVRFVIGKIACLGFEKWTRYHKLYLFLDHGSNRSNTLIENKLNHLSFCLLKIGSDSKMCCYALLIC